MTQRAESKTVKPMRLDIGDNYYRGYRISLHDETRTMQNFLMDTIVSFGEQITGEPL